MLWDLFGNLNKWLALSCYGRFISVCVFSKHLFQNTLTLLITRVRLQHLVFVKTRKFLFCPYETVES